MNHPNVGLYVHTPFCRRKCPYCHFFVLKNAVEAHQAFLEALHGELDRVLPCIPTGDIRTLYLGGGTPALLEVEALESIVSRARAHGKPCEITLEANPEEITAERVKAWHEIGINRLSIGVQSFDDSLLKRLGRQHSADDAAQAVLTASRAGIPNITIDLMYDIPHQTMEMWQETVARACDLPITHLSLYNLTFEPGAAFFRRRKALAQHVPQEEVSAQMYVYAVSALAQAGLEQYEISAFCRDGLQSEHNTGYWRGRPYFGIGPSAHSYWNGDRFHNVANLKEYQQRITAGESAVQEWDRLPADARQRELLVIALRLVEGVNLNSFGVLDDTTSAVLTKLKIKGLIIIDGNWIKLTDQGRRFYDTVATELI